LNSRLSAGLINKKLKVEGLASSNEGAKMITMGTEEQNSEPTRSASKTSKRFKPDRRWTLLFMGDHGRVITLKRFKGLVLLGGLVLSISVAITFGLYFFSHNIVNEKNTLESDLENAEKELKALRHEKDILMARLVLAESRLQQNLGGRAENEDKTASDNPVKKESEETPNNPVAKKLVDEKPTTLPAVEKREAPAQRQPKPEPDGDESETQLSVAIENFQLTHLSETNTVRVQFKIKNTTPNSQYVSGYAIVVLKGDQIQQNNWFSIPGVPLVAGKPTGQRRGHAFGINYFRTMRFTAVAPKSLEKFQTAVVFVFTHAGELLLEQDFPINVPPSNGSASKPPSIDSAPASTDSVTPTPSNTSSQ
jgi:hypothetical protein